MDVETDLVSSKILALAKNSRDLIIKGVRKEVISDKQFLKCLEKLLCEFTHQKYLLQLTSHQPRP